MSDDKKSSEKNSRREFLKKIGLISSAGIAGSMALYTGYKFEKSKGKDNKIKVLTADNKLIEIDKDQLNDVKPNLEKFQLRGREGVKSRRWVMVIDLSKCKNARKCVNACQTAHELKPEQFHINTLAMQDAEDTAPYYMPKPCQHCDNPPCVSVCPVGATFKRQDGIVLIDNERCIGCRFCVAACPYSARVFNWGTPKKVESEKDKIYDVELNTPQKKGTISKCLFSADKLRKGELPYCVSACPNGVFWFGDQNEDSVTNGTTKKTTSFSKLIEKKAGYTLMPELGTKPRVYYLPPKNRLFKFEKSKKKI